jgi:nitrogenase-associated protein
MAIVTFYEKPNCANNSKQKRLLTEAGHTVIAKNILTEAWQADTLRPFFTGLAVRDWFNYSAPAIKLGEIDPEIVSEEQAISLMLENPILIRRPLLQVGTEYRAGFDAERVQAWLSVHSAEDIETCTKKHGSECRHG